MNCSPYRAVGATLASAVTTVSGVRRPLSKADSMFRPGTPEQLQKASRMVSRAVSAGSATANSGSRSTRRVSQVTRPASTREAASIVVIDFVMEPIIIRVSGVTGRVLPISLTPKPLRYTTSPFSTTATAAPGTPNR